MRPSAEHVVEWRLSPDADKALRTLGEHRVAPILRAWALRQRDLMQPPSLYALALSCYSQALEDTAAAAAMGRQLFPVEPDPPIVMEGL